MVGFELMTRRQPPPCQKHFRWEVFWPWWIWQSTLLFVVDHNKSPMRSGASLFWCFSHLTAQLHFQTWKSVNGLGFDKGHALVQIFFGTEIRQTASSESQLPIKHLGQGQLIFCLCFAGEQSKKKRGCFQVYKGQEDPEEFDHHYLTAPWEFLLQVGSGTPWHFCPTECVQ